MKLQFALLLSASLLAVACSSSKKTTTTDGTSSTDSRKLGKYQMYDESAFQLTGISEDAGYGYSAEKAINVGSGSDPYKTGAANERKYLNALLGPDGQTVSYERRGSCCGVKSKYSPFGTALLDVYIITYDGLEKPVELYINMYDPGDDLKAPKGFTFRK